jgi:hypothetical protein
LIDPHPEENNIASLRESFSARVARTFQAIYRGEEQMQTVEYEVDTARYAKCIEASKRVRWDIEKDVIRGRNFDFAQKFLPDGLSKVNQLEFLNDAEKRLLSQIQGRTYANIFGLVERFITAKILELSHDHWLGDQTALEGLVRFSDEELKHQELFRMIEEMIASGLPEGYSFVPQPDEVAKVILGKSTWAVLALTLHIELFTQTHYTESIDPDENLSELFKDVFLFHWKEESQHAIMDDLEWRRLDKDFTPEERDRAVDEFIELVGAVDGILQAQAESDAKYFLNINERKFSEEENRLIWEGILKAYRWQYIISGAQHKRFQEILGNFITQEQGNRINEALAPIM